MSVAELKQVLHDKIDHLTAEQLPMVKEFLEQIEAHKIVSKPSMDDIWNELVAKYDSTLSRLAQ
jgi:hypothetical protein